MNAANGGPVPTAAFLLDVHLMFRYAPSMKLDAALLDEEVLIGRIVASVHAVAGVPLAQITLDARLHEDLELDGGSGYALMESLHDQFEMDWTGFDLNAHFGSCGAARPLTISELARALRDGYWPRSSSSARLSSVLALLAGTLLMSMGPILAGTIGR
jgi:hypothetical protein